MKRFVAELSTFGASYELRVSGRGRLYARTLEAAAEEAWQFHETALGSFGAYLVRFAEVTQEEWDAVGPEYAALAAGAVDLSLYR